MDHDTWLNSGNPLDLPEIDATEDHYDRATAEICGEMSNLVDVLMDSPWIAEHAAYLYDNLPTFAAEVSTHFEDQIRERAYEIAESDHESAIEESRIASAESARDSYYDR